MFLVKGIAALVVFNFIVLNWFLGITTGFHVIHEYEKGVVLRLGKLHGVEEPGLNYIWPFFDTVHVVKSWDRVEDIPSQQVVTKDLVTLLVDGVLRYKVVEPETALIKINNYKEATVQFSLTTIKEAIGEIEYEKVVSTRSELNTKIMGIVKSKAQDWGVEVKAIEIKKVVPVDSKVQKALTKRAIAEQEKQARLILSQAEKEIAKHIVEASEVLSKGGYMALRIKELETIEKFSQVQGGNFLLPLSIGADHLKDINNNKMDAPHE